MPALIFWALDLHESGDLQSSRMITHIALMTIAAPMLANGLRKEIRWVTEPVSRASLPAATLLQAALFLAWHSPSGPAMAGQDGDGVMHATLFFSSLWFWLAVFNQDHMHSWRAVVALLLTAKLFCLIAVLLTFAPRVLYVSDATAPHPAMTADLVDQQLAGLLMIVACPLTYVLAAILLVYRWFQSLCGPRSEAAHSTPVSENVS
ncbi:MAG: cytochrome c oxidase assembly protein [Gammaproteobacteria bacterium]